MGGQCIMNVYVSNGELLLFRYIFTHKLMYFIWVPVLCITLSNVQTDTHSGVPVACLADLFSTDAPKTNHSYTKNE